MQPGVVKIDLDRGWREWLKPTGGGRVEGGGALVVRMLHQRGILVLLGAVE